MNNKQDRCKHGFTLAELLIVVAIISVLVVVSVPVFNAQLDKAKIAANEANIRAAQAAVLTDLMSNDADGAAEKHSPIYYYSYDVATGTLVDNVSVGIKGSNGVYDRIFVFCNTATNVYWTRPHYVSNKTKFDEIIKDTIGKNEFAE
ncbi:MAG: prepilin-type N-terminal cleavage/methylation domain-containing protein [Solobacterium sp.]|jgi:prepilin-type N-terminal cleavage/methylation domain-containing protein|nr:prepilin-type N-terminal cleavage/methylation domain-containing protein [Solobacterium sp.]